MRSLLLSAALAVPALADTHYFFSGFFSGSTVVGAEFDDVASTLTLVNNISTSASSGSKWIAIDVSASKSLQLLVY
jgi:carboxy-cis,cis-muconate cyclase